MRIPSPRGEGQGEGKGDVSNPSAIELHRGFCGCGVRKGFLSMPAVSAQRPSPQPSPIRWERENVRRLLAKFKPRDRSRCSWNLECLWLAFSYVVILMVF